MRVINKVPPRGKDFFDLGFRHFSPFLECLPDVPFRTDMLQVGSDGSQTGPNDLSDHSIVFLFLPIAN